MPNVKFIHKKKTFCLFLTLFFTMTLSAQYTINDVFSDPAETTNMTRDVFAVWWDNSFDYSAEADVLLDEMIAYKAVCLNELNLQIPQSTIDGYYINVYIHADGGYYDMYGWGNGMGTDSNGYPYLTLPFFVLPVQLNTAHETFHLFQHNTNSPGFYYQGDKQWYTEASANWFASIQHPDETRAFITSEILVRLPHVPLWLGWLNAPPSYPDNWQRENHQYALGLFLYYLTNVESVPQTLITEGYYANTNLNPQEYLYENIGGEALRSYFIDWAAHMTNDFDFINQVQKDANLQEWNTYADLNDDNEFTESFDSNGSGGWFQAADDLITTAWSFNTYKLNNDQTTTYTFEVDGEPTGSNGDPSYFEAKLVVKNSSSGMTSFYDVPMSGDQQGSLSLDVTSDDSEVLFIVASMPEVFDDANVEFQTFPYQIRISNETLGRADIDKSDILNVYPNPVEDILIVNHSTVEPLSFSMFSSEGRKVPVTYWNDGNSIHIDTSILSAAVYFLQFETNFGKETIRVIKE